MAEHVQPGGRERRTRSARGDEQPVLSRYARHRGVAPEDASADGAPDDQGESEAAPTTPRHAGPPDAGSGAEPARSAAAVDDDVEISPPSPELPPPPTVGRERAAEEEDAREPDALPRVAAAADRAAEASREAASPGPAPAPSSEATGAPASLGATAASPAGPSHADGAAHPDEEPAPPVHAARPAEGATERGTGVRADSAESGEKSAGTPAPEVSGAASGEEPIRRVEASHFDAPERGESRWAREIVPSSRGRTDDGAAHRKVPFWKRIALPLVQSATAAAQADRTKAGPASRPASLEPVLTRLSALEKQLAANQAATEGQLARFEENITRLWELEEQLTLTEVRERLALLEANQEEIADGLHTVSRNLVLVAVVLATGIAAGLLALGLLL